MKLQMEEMSWPSIKEAADRGFKTVLIPIGSIEQHGRHLPTFTDSLLAHYLSEKIAERLGRTLVAPVIRPGCSEHHLAFPGTITVPPKVLNATVDAYIGSLRRGGFKNFILIPTHGGNFAPLKKAHRNLVKKHRGAKIYGYFDLDRFVGVMNRISAEFNITPEASGAHSGFAETSCVRAVRDDLVDMNSAEAGYVGPFDEKVRMTIFKKGMTALTRNGVLGDPNGASAEAGRRITETLVTEVVEMLHESGLKT